MKEVKTFTKIRALEYLIMHNVYGNEWQGAGMYESIEEMMKHKGKITQKYLDNLLKEAEDR